MSPLFRINRIGLAAIAALAVLAAAGPSARADQPLTNLGPVGPHEPILVSMGSQRIIAFYSQDRDGCAVTAVMWKDADPDAPYSSSRVRIALKPGQMFQLDSAQRQSMSLVCGADAASLSVTAPAELILAGSSDSRK
jgi:hypothetical protein